MVAAGDIVSAAADAILVIALAFVMVPVSLLLLQVVCAVLPRRPAVMPSVDRPRLAVIVPAHNESGIIRKALESVRPQLGQGDRLVVVADNCTDDTARIAADFGAEVIERYDESRRGKGYALDAGVRYLDREPPGLVIIVDADCEVAPEAIERIARVSASTARPVQALYLMTAPASSGAMAAIAEFAWIVKNLVRPLGFLRLGLPCQLMGTGMAFPWAVIRAAPLASGHLVEDLRLGLDLARLGRPALFCPEAVVRSRFPAGAENTRSQRVRWEHGHLGTILSEAPRLLWAGLRGNGSGSLALGLDLAVPPLALLALSIVGLFALCAIHALVTSSIGPVVAAGAIALLFAAAIGVAWLRFGREILSFSGLLFAFAYACRKIPLYVRFVVGRQVEWVRSKRDEP